MKNRKSLLANPQKPVCVAVGLALVSEMISVVLSEVSEQRRGASAQSLGLAAKL